MNSELLYSVLTLILMAPLFVIARRSLGLVFLGSVALFVIALPWLRLFFVEESRIYDISHVDQEMALKYISIYLFSVGVAITSFHFRDLGAFDSDWIKNMRRAPNNIGLLNSCILILVVVWAVRIFRGFSYGILFSGSGDEFAIANQSYVFVVVTSLSEMMALGAFFCLVIFNNQKNKIIWILIFAEIFWALISGGRRNLIFMVSVLAYVEFFAIKKFSFKSLFLLVPLGYFIASVVSPIFILVRQNVLNYMQMSDAFTSIAWGIQDAYFDFIQFGSLTSKISSENLAERGDVGQFVESIIYSTSKGYSFTYGEALFNAFSWSVPSLLISKPTLMVEQYIQSALGMPLIDDAISWIAVGYIDFGLIGCFLYGVIFSCLIYSLIHVSKKSNNNMLFIIGSIQSCFLMFSLEADPLMLFAAIREFCIILLIFKIGRMLPYFNRR